MLRIISVPLPALIFLPSILAQEYAPRTSYTQTTGVTGNYNYAPRPNIAIRNETFNVSKTTPETRPQLHRLYALVNEKFTTNDDGRITLATRVPASRIKIIQRFREDEFLCRVLSAQDPSRFYVYQASSPRNYVDDDIVTLYVAIDNTPYEYINTSGAKLSVRRLFDAKDNANGVSQEAFINALKSGVEFEVSEAILEKCKACSGFGKIRDERDRLSLSRTIRCPNCYGEKELQTIKHWTIQW